MGKRVFCILFTALLVTSMLSVVYHAESQPEQPEFSNNLKSDLSKALPQPFTQEKVSSDYISGSIQNGFNPTGLPQNSSYFNLDGNMTRLAVGINAEDQAKVYSLEKIAALDQAAIVDMVKMKGKIRYVVFELPLTTSTRFIEDVREAKLSSYIEPSMKFQAQFAPNDPYWNQQWGPQKIHADFAWNTTTGDPSIIVAVVDTGIYYTHPDIAPNYVPLGYDWAYKDSDPMDDYGHGTHCAGIIAAALDNSIGIAGLAQVRVMAEKVLDRYGYGYDDWIANGIINATDSGAKIISMSLGGYSDSQLIRDAVKYAYDAGVLLVAAAGNSDTNIKSYPAAYDEVIAVAATDQGDNKAYFSNYGDWIELAAPGVDIYSTVPSNGYMSASGTSMACPHVSGVAALVWSEYPNRTRDWVRSWLRYTADDLGVKGFDIYYGYGRINAQKAVETQPPTHELIAYRLNTPPYVKPGYTASINGTVLNFGEDETNIILQLFVNATLVDSTTIGSLSGGNFVTASLMWTPTFEGTYNVTFYIVPVMGETIVENNALEKSVFVGFPVKAVVLHSAGNIIGEIITNWHALMDDWQLFGDKMVYIDYVSLNKEGITYDDIASTEADVLIISCAYDPSIGWQFTDPEINAITRYVHEGHGLVITSGTFYYSVPNNNKLAPLVGLNKTTRWTTTGTDLMHLLNTTQPIFAGVPNPLVFPMTTTALPYDGRWDQNELANGQYDAIGHFQESAITTYKGLVYISPILEYIPAYYHHHLQLLYNAMRWSRYQKPDHELAVSLQAPLHVQPGETALINATVTNVGVNNETNVNLELLISDASVAAVTIPNLLNGTSETIEYEWSPTSEGKYNVTAYAPPVPGEDNPNDNAVTKILRVRYGGGLVVFDESHMPVYSIGNNPAADVSGGYFEFANYLGLNGYVISTIDPGTTITPDILQPITVLIIAAPQYTYASSELDAIDSWIKAGGNLLLISDWVIWGTEARTIASRFGIAMKGDGICSSVHNVGASLWPYYERANMLTHPVTEGVNRIEMYASDGITSSSTEESKLVVTSMDYTAYWYHDGTPALGISVVSAFEGQTTGSGKIVLVTDSNIWDSANDVDGDGQIDFFDSDNSILALNCVDWLSARYQHELSVRLDAPDFVEPASTVQLGAIVQNKGLNNETNVSLQLFINDTLVYSVSPPELDTSEEYTLNYLWTPTIEGVYNITAYAPKVQGEEYSGNNVQTKIVTVKQVKRVLFDETHGNDAMYNYRTWTASLQKRGYIIDTLNTSPITTSLLDGYDVLVSSQAYMTYTFAELSAIQDFVLAGGGLLVIGDDNPYIYTDLTGFAGIQWSSGGTSGPTTDITPHPVTAGVSTVNLVAPVAFITVNGTAQGLVRDPSHNIMLAVSEQPPGKVAGFADEDTLMDYGIIQADNMRLANNLIDWLSVPTPSDHDLVASLEVPTLIRIGASTTINASVHNRGLNNETNMEVQLLINGTQVDSANIQELLVGQSYMLHYAWTPQAEGTYNITAYAPPLVSEEFVRNNVAKNIVNVRHFKGFVLWDSTHFDDYQGYYSSWITDLVARGYVVDTLGGSVVTPDSLDGYDVFIIPQATVQYAPDELLAVENFVKAGGGLLVIGDDFPNIYDSLTRFAAISWQYGAGGVGTMTDITPHPVTNGVTAVYFGSPMSALNVSSPAQSLIRNQNGETMVAASRVGPGKVIGIADEDPLMNYDIGVLDNFVLARNVVDWLSSQGGRTGGTHDVAVTNVSVSPGVIYNGWIVEANVTVANLGNSTETFDLALYYDNNVITVQTINDLAPYTTLDLNFSWNTVNVAAGRNYTISAVASTVWNETDTVNNVFTDGSIQVRLFGDINNDGGVNIFDAVQAALAFGTGPSDLKWNQWVDVNRDSIINIYDMVQIAKHFNEHT